MAASEAPVIISAAITAAAVLSAQGITQFFGGRRDTSRLQWERGRQEREWEIRRGERFLDLKRELYSDYLVEAGEIMIYINWEEESGEPQPDEPPNTAALRRIQERISLVAPRSLFTKVQSASATVTGAMWAVAAGAEPEDVREEKTEAMRALAAMRRDMRADLRGEEDRHFGGLEKVPPDPPPGHLRFWRRFPGVRPFRR